MNLHTRLVPISHFLRSHKIANFCVNLIKCYSPSNLPVCAHLTACTLSSLRLHQMHEHTHARIPLRNCWDRKSCFLFAFRLMLILFHIIAAYHLSLIRNGASVIINAPLIWVPFRIEKKSWQDECSHANKCGYTIETQNLYDLLRTLKATLRHVLRGGHLMR